MHPKLSEAVTLLQNLPEDVGIRDHAMITAMIDIMKSCENPFGMLISLCVTCVHFQENSQDAFLRFINIVTASYLQYEEELKAIMQEAKEGTIH